MAFATPKPRVSEKTAAEEDLAQARAQAVQMVERAYPAFQEAVTDAANREVRSLGNNRDLTQKLTEEFNTYLNGRTPTQDLLDRFMSLKGSDIVYNFAQQEGLALFYQFGTFSYNYSSGKLSISEQAIDEQKLNQFLSDFNRNCEDRITWGLYGTHADGPENSGIVSGMYDITLQTISELFTSEVAYAGNQASPVAVSDVPRSKLPLTLDENGIVRWSIGVLSKDAQVSG